MRDKRSLQVGNKIWALRDPTAQNDCFRVDRIDDESQRSRQTLGMSIQRLLCCLMALPGEFDH